MATARRVKKLTREQKRAAWAGPESNAGEGWDGRSTAGLPVEDPNNPERIMREFEGQ